VRDWDLHCLEIVAYQKKHGALQLPYGEPKYEGLMAWIEDLKQRHSTLETDKIRRLLELGVTFGGRDSAWYRSYFELVDFIKANGQFPVGRSALARWVEYQRRLYNQEELPAHRVRRLNELNIVWRVDVFAERYEELKAFFAEHGHSNVPWNYPKNPGLGHYICNTLRAERGRLSPEQVAKLEALNFVWDVREEAWQQHFADLKAHLAQYGCYPTIATNLPLASWVRAQRKLKPSDERSRQLDAIGFAWDPREESWMERYGELAAFQKRHGHCRIPARDPKYHQLWDWLHFQKTKRKRIPAKRRRLLDELGVDWSIEKRTPIEKKLERLRALHKKQGHCNVSVTEDRALAGWLAGVRRRKDRLSPELFQELQSLGIDWDPVGTHWNARFDELAAFQREHGHARVPIRWPENPPLGTWVYTQRRRWAQLNAEKRRRLSAIGVLPL